MNFQDCTFSRITKILISASTTIWKCYKKRQNLPLWRERRISVVLVRRHVRLAFAVLVPACRVLCGPFCYLAHRACKKNKTENCEHSCYETGVRKKTLVTSRKNYVILERFPLRIVLRQYSTILYSHSTFDWSHMSINHSQLLHSSFPQPNPEA